MSDRQPEPPRSAGQRSVVTSILLFGFGVILLLPGLCSLFFLGSIGGDPTVASLAFICLLISAGGVVMIVKAFSR